jgi:DNA-binding NarL/FixJ family response regulator
VVVEFVVVTRGEFVWQRIEGEVRRLRGLGMALQAIGRALGVDEKTVRNVLAR